jgi:hypothetical protein
MMVDKLQFWHYPFLVGYWERVRMKSLKTLLIAVGLTCLGVWLAPLAQASDWDRKTVLTFDQPVEVPGTVLPAGAYVFNFLGSTADRNIIEVLSQDGQKLYATVEAIPDYRADAEGDSTIVFEDGKAGAAQAIREWFFPDRRYGHQFVYPGMGVLEIGESNGLVQETAGIERTEEPDESDYWRALHLKQENPFELGKADGPREGNVPAERAELSYLQALQRKQAEEQGQTQTAMIRELPRTAGRLHLFLLSGISMVAIGLSLHIYSKT